MEAGELDADFAVCTKFHADRQREREPGLDAYRSGVRVTVDGIDTDENAIVSCGDPEEGAYVMAWIWVSNEDAGIEPETADETEDEAHEG